MLEENTIKGKKNVRNNSERGRTRTENRKTKNKKVEWKK